jgi:hypothetical protein
MKALIDPNSEVKYISDWILVNNRYNPVYSIYPNSQRVCETIESEFPIAPPLYWLDCSDTIVADQYYYDVVQSQFFPVVDAPMPIQDNPIGTVSA